MNRTVILPLLVLLLAFLPAAALDLNDRSLSIDPELFAAGGGDGDSPWPVFFRLLTRDHALSEMHSAGASLGSAQLFSWSERDERDHEIRLVRLHSAEGTEIFHLTDNRLEDTCPEIVGTEHGVSVLWQQKQRGRRVLLAQELDRDGRPSGTPHRLATLDESIVSITALPLGPGTFLLGQARRDGSITVIEIVSPSGLRLPFATVPAEYQVRVYFETGNQGMIHLRWTEAPATQAQTPAAPRTRALRKRP